MNFAKTPRQSILKRLARDTTGNTLMLVAAATIPLTGMIGAGVDISRSYLVKSRLQAACDAGALAARKFMSGTTLSADTLAKSRAFFNNNFPDKSFGSTDITFTPTVAADNEVKGTATAKLPMTVMTMFNNKFTDITVKCDAKMEISNTDVALVLDVTGSMAESLDGSTRIAVLKEAVINFYGTLGPGEDARGRIRYAVVPYSTNVNLKGVLPDDALIGGNGPDTWVYQTRVAKMDKPIYTAVSSEDLGYETYNAGASISKTNCSNYGKNAWPTNGGNPVVVNGPGTPPASKTSTNYSNNSTAGVDWGWSGAADSKTSDNNASCRRKRVRTDLDLEYAFNGWLYKRASVDVGGYAAGDTVNIFTGSSSQLVKVEEPDEYDLREIANTAGFEVSGGISSVSWSGCIEERDTKNDITASTPVTYDPEDEGAYDLDINTLPVDDATRWRPIWTELLYTRTTLAESTAGTKKAEYGCPADPARRLMQYASIDSAPTGFSGLSSFRSFINNLSIGSGTMHDIGLIWGARILSGEGLFAADNPDTWAGQEVARHLIFMTDGEMNAHEDEFVFHGNNQLDQRVAPRGTSKADIDKIHNRRLRIACEQAKQQDITVWVIAFAEGKKEDYPDLKACASTESQYKFAKKAADLDNVFRDIANQIAQLRLTK